MWSPGRRIQFDTHPFPLVVVTFHDRWDAAELLWMFEQFETLFRQVNRYALIVDTTRASNVPNAIERKLISDWDIKNSPHTERHSVGAAIVFSSALMRSYLTALAWCVQHKTPTVYLPTVDAAASWCAEKLQGASIPLSVEARSFLFTRAQGKTS